MIFLCYIEIGICVSKFFLSELMFNPLLFQHTSFEICAQLFLFIYFSKYTHKKSYMYISYIYFIKLIIPEDHIFLKLKNRFG